MPSRPIAPKRAVRRPSRPRRAAAAPNDASARQLRSSNILPFLTVAIGASAGGLHAFSSFLTALPPDTGMAFALIQHLDPNHKSLLVSLLRSHTILPVVEAQDGMPLMPNAVFVIPPDATMTVHDGRLAVSRPAPGRASRHPIDSCFMSLADDQQYHAVAIVLSGAGSDGSLGLAAIKQHGGLTLAQSEDDGPVLTGMPHSAVATGLVDFQLPIEAMPAKLLAHQDALRKAAPPPDTHLLDSVDALRFAELCALLRNQTGHDFSGYKQATLLRRIRRRMQIEQIATLSGYVELLRHNPQQVDRLFRELLIHVTQFMRDTTAFQAVRDSVLPKLLSGKGATDTVRIWVPGCASGEEVYSLAIMLRELMAELQSWPKVQIFGTDIAEAAIANARAGHYSRAALSCLPPAQRSKWFVEDGTKLVLTRAIREMCIFSVHSVTKDPPFSKLDLISCRNLLIYLGHDLQVRVLRSFHYGLNPGGILFLGPSESVAAASGLFSELDKRHRIYERREVTEGVSGMVHGSPSIAPREYRPRAAYAGAAFEDAIDRNARRGLEPFSPAYVVIDRSHEIIRFSGGVIGRFLEPSPGIASLNLFDILRKTLRTPVRAALRNVVAKREPVVQQRLLLPFDGRNHTVTMIVKPIGDGRVGQEFYLVAFQDAGPTRARARGPVATEADLSRTPASELADELSATRAQLMTTISELETSNEEMKSANEEYLSANEELQATNEELETAKEEMQSVNEELQTINAELAAKNDLLVKLNQDFQNLMDSTQIPTLFLNVDLHVTRFSPRVTELFRLRESDIGRPITEITSRLNYTTIAADVAAVLDGLEVVEREVQAIHGDASFLMQMRPYRAPDDRIEGVVITFVDVSAPKRLLTEEALRDVNLSLERRVAERTAELQAASDALTQQIRERQRTEDMLRQSQKMEAIGKLTGGIAHDFNNLLGVIIGNAEILLDTMADRPDEAEQAREILESALSGAELTRRMLAFARRQPLQPRCIDLNVLLPNQVTMLRRMLGETIEVSMTLAPGLWLTTADPSQIGNALLNLALNARDAMPRGGRLSIATGNVHLSNEDIAQHAEATAGDYVVLAVSDNGVGMPPEVIERATEPFFTTKGSGAGTGLGLSMIYGFAKQSGGHLEIESAVASGTTVRLYLRRAADGDADGIAAADAAAADAGGNETILVVDDNLTLRDVTRRHLNALGYRVDLAASGPAALARLRSGERFDLLFTDVVMPEGMTGYELAEAARAVQGDLKVLFTTGYAGDAALLDDDDADNRPLLRKPYRRHELAEKVRAALDAA